MVFLFRAVVALWGRDERSMQARVAQLPQSPTPLQFIFYAFKQSFGALAVLRVFTQKFGGHTFDNVLAALGAPREPAWRGVYESGEHGPQVVCGVNSIGGWRGIEGGTGRGGKACPLSRGGD